MPIFLRLRRVTLFGLTMLSACAADFRQSADASRPEPVNLQVSTPTGAYLAGLSAVTDGDMATASNLFLQGLAFDPQNGDLQNAAFLATLQAGRPEAVDLARAMPGGIAAQLVLANADVKAGRWAAAEGRFSGILRQGPVQLLQPILIAWSQLGGGRQEAAMSTLRPLAEASRFRGTYALHAAIIADLTSRGTEADRYYRIAQASSGGINLEMARILASYFQRSGHPAEAQQLFAGFDDNIGNVAISLPGLYRDSAQLQVRNAVDGLAEAYLTLASALHNEIGLANAQTASAPGRRPRRGSSQDGAIEAADDMATVLLQLAIDLRPDLTMARLLASEMLDEKSRPRAALAMLARVSDSDPLWPMVQLRRAVLLASIKDPDAALKILDSLNAAFPDRPEPYSMRGDIEHDAKHYAASVKAYTAAIARLGHETQQNWTLYYQRGISQERAGDWPKAEADFQHALQLAPEQPFVLNYLAYSWTERGENLDKARQMIERAVALRPNDGAIIDSLGWLVLRQGNVAGAVQLLQHAAELEPADPTVNGHLGDAYWAAGRKLEAQFQWRRALTLDPDPDDIGKLQVKLRKSEEALGNIAAVPAPAKAATP